MLRNTLRLCKRLKNFIPTPNHAGCRHASALPAIEERCIKHHLEELDDKGFTVVPEIFTPEEVEQLQKEYLKIKQRTTEIIDTIPPRPRVWEETGKMVQSQYWKTDTEVMLQAGVGRYDCWKGFSNGILATENVRRNPLISKLMEELLVCDYTTYQGVVLSGANSDGQYFHRDTDSLQNKRSCGTEMVKLDDFYFTVLMPCLVNVTMDNGPTEFYAGSHRQPAYEFDDKTLERVCAPLGSALVFNGKLYHRGSANRSNEDRPVIYQVWHKMWYNDYYRDGVDETDGK